MLSGVEVVRTPSFPIQEIYSWLRARIFPQIQLPILSLSPSFSQMMLKGSLDAARTPLSHEGPYKYIGARVRFLTLKSISRPITSHLTLIEQLQSSILAPLWSI